MPMLTPIMNTMATGTKPTTIETRAPQMSRLRMSRPIWSVPKGWRASTYLGFPQSGSRREGFARPASSKVVSGSKGATRGANAAAMPATRMMKRPSIAALCFRRRSKASPASERCFRASTFSAAARSAPVSGRSTVATLLPYLDPRVEHAVHEVHREVGHRDDEREQQEDTHDQRVVTAAGAAHELPSDARN